MGFAKHVLIAGTLSVFGLVLSGGTAQAQATDDFDASATTNAAAGIVCGQNLSFGRVYVSTSNAQASVSVSGLGTLNSNHASVVAAGSTLGQCTISGLQNGDTVSVTLSGGGGTLASGGLSAITLDDGASHTLLAAVQVSIVGTPISGGRTGVGNGVIPISGLVIIPAGHIDFGTYTTTLTATAALN